MNGVQVCGVWQLAVRQQNSGAYHASGFIDEKRCSCSHILFSITVENALIYVNSRFSFDVSFFTVFFYHCVDVGLTMCT